jgi:hypothetical protein
VKCAPSAALSVHSLTHCVCGSVTLCFSAVKCTLREPSCSGLCHACLAAAQNTSRAGWHVLVGIVFISSFEDNFRIKNIGQLLVSRIDMLLLSGCRDRTVASASHSTCVQDGNIVWQDCQHVGTFCRILCRECSHAGLVGSQLTPWKARWRQ